MAALPVLARVPLLPSAPDGGKQPDGLLDEGLFLASRSLCAAADSEHRRTTERSYALRARWRPTPFGVFAGVTWAVFDSTGRTQLALGQRHQARSLPSGEWLSEIASVVVGDSAVLGGLTLSGNSLAVRRGDRLETEVPARPDTPAQRTTIRVTPVTEMILALAACGISFRELHAELCRRWPEAPPERFTAVMGTMIRTGFLMTDLLPVQPTDDPLSHLSGRLPQQHRLREPLLRLRDLLTEADSLPPGDPARLAALRSARHAADALTMQESPLSVDTAADATIILPKSVGDQAAAAAAALWKAGRDPDPLEQFHRRFLERYGRHRNVPLLELLNPATGLGFDPAQRDFKDLPPVAWFLHLAGLARTCPWKSWSWEHLADMPFQPRVRYGSTILAPARWTLPLPMRKASTDRAAWARHLDCWIQTTIPPPPLVIVTDDLDRRLPLDLSRSDDRELLRRYVRAGLTTIAEPPGGAGSVQEVVAGPHGNHVVELVVPLTSRLQTRRQQPQHPNTMRPPRGKRKLGDGRFLPGSEWLSLAIPGPAHCLDDLLISLAAFVDRNHLGPWFWLRYSNPQHGPHLRARFHAKRPPWPSAPLDGAVRRGRETNLAWTRSSQEIKSPPHPGDSRRTTLVIPRGSLGLEYATS